MAREAQALQERQKMEQEVLRKRQQQQQEQLLKQQQQQQQAQAQQRAQQHALQQSHQAAGQQQQLQQGPSGQQQQQQGGASTKPAQQMILDVRRYSLGCMSLTCFEDRETTIMNRRKIYGVCRMKERRGGVVTRGLPFSALLILKPWWSKQLFDHSALLATK
jgi:hypothetical protein